MDPNEWISNSGELEGILYDCDDDVAECYDLDEDGELVLIEND